MRAGERESWVMRQYAGPTTVTTHGGGTGAGASSAGAAVAAAAAVSAAAADLKQADNSVRGGGRSGRRTAAARKPTSAHESVHSIMQPAHKSAYQIATASVAALQHTTTAPLDPAAALATASARANAAAEASARSIHWHLPSANPFRRVSFVAPTSVIPGEPLRARRLDALATRVTHATPVAAVSAIPTIDEWLHAYVREKRAFASASLFADVKWHELNELTAGVGVPSKVRTAVSLDLWDTLAVHSVSSTNPRLRHLMLRLRTLLLPAIYAAGRVPVVEPAGGGAASAGGATAGDSATSPRAGAGAAAAAASTDGYTYVSLPNPDAPGAAAEQLNAHIQSLLLHSTSNATAAAAAAQATAAADSAHADAVTAYLHGTEWYSTVGGRRARNRRLYQALRAQMIPSKVYRLRQIQKRVVCNMIRVWHRALLTLVFWEWKHDATSARRDKADHRPQRILEIHTHLVDKMTRLRVRHMFTAWRILFLERRAIRLSERARDLDKLITDYQSLSNELDVQSRRVTAEVDTANATIRQFHLHLQTISLKLDHSETELADTSDYQTRLTSLFKRLHEPLLQSLTTAQRAAEMVAHVPYSHVAIKTGVPLALAAVDGSSAPVQTSAPSSSHAPPTHTRGTSNFERVTHKSAADILLSWANFHIGAHNAKLPGGGASSSSASAAPGSRPSGAASRSGAATSGAAPPNAPSPHGSSTAGDAAAAAGPDALRQTLGGATSSTGMAPPSHSESPMPPVSPRSDHSGSSGHSSAPTPAPQLPRSSSQSTLPAGGAAGSSSASASEVPFGGHAPLPSLDALADRTVRRAVLQTTTPHARTRPVSRPSSSGRFPPGAGGASASSSSGSSAAAAAASGASQSGGSRGAAPMLRASTLKKLGSSQSSLLAHQHVLQGASSGGSGGAGGAGGAPSSIQATLHAHKRTMSGRHLSGAGSFGPKQHTFEDNFHRLFRQLTDHDSRDAVIAALGRLFEADLCGRPILPPPDDVPTNTGSAPGTGTAGGRHHHRGGPPPAASSNSRLPGLERSSSRGDPDSTGGGSKLAASNSAPKLAPAAGTPGAGSTPSPQPAAAVAESPQPPSPQTGPISGSAAAFSFAGASASSSAAQQPLQPRLAAQTLADIRYVVGLLSTMDYARLIRKVEAEDRKRTDAFDRHTEQQLAAAARQKKQDEADIVAAEQATAAQQQRKLLKPSAETRAKEKEQKEQAKKSGDAKGDSSDDSDADGGGSDDEEAEAKAKQREEQQRERDRHSHVLNIKPLNTALAGTGPPGGTSSSGSGGAGLASALQGKPVVTLEEDLKLMDELSSKLGASMSASDSALRAAAAEQAQLDALADQVFADTSRRLALSAVPASVHAADTTVEVYKFELQYLRDALPPAFDSRDLHASEQLISNFLRDLRHIFRSYCGHTHATSSSVPQQLATGSSIRERMSHGKFWRFVRDCRLVQGSSAKLDNVWIAVLSAHHPKRAGSRPAPVKTDRSGSRPRGGGDQSGSPTSAMSTASAGGGDDTIVVPAAPSLKAAMERATTPSMGAAPAILKVVTTTSSERAASLLLMSPALAAFSGTSKSDHSQTPAQIASAGLRVDPTAPELSGAAAAGKTPGGTASSPVAATPSAANVTGLTPMAANGRPGSSSNKRLSSSQHEQERAKAAGAAAGTPSAAEGRTSHGRRRSVGGGGNSRPNSRPTSATRSPSRGAAPRSPNSGGGAVSPKPGSTRHASLSRPLQTPRSAARAASARSPMHHARTASEQQVASMAAALTAAEAETIGSTTVAAASESPNSTAAAGAAAPVRKVRARSAGRSGAMRGGRSSGEPLSAQVPGSTGTTTAGRRGRARGSSDAPPPLATITSGRAGMNASHVRHRSGSEFAPDSATSGGGATSDSESDFDDALGGAGYGSSGVAAHDFTFAMFLEALIRLAIVKFGANSGAAPVPAASSGAAAPDTSLFRMLYRLLLQHILPYAGAQIAGAGGSRRGGEYTSWMSALSGPKVDAVLRKHSTLLTAMFRVYQRSSAPAEAGSSGHSMQTMALKDFLRMAKDYALLNVHLTHHDVTRLFVAIQKDATASTGAAGTAAGGADVDATVAAMAAAAVAAEAKAAAVAAGGADAKDAATTVAGAAGATKEAVLRDLSYREFLEFLAAASCYVIRNPFFALPDKLDKFITQHLKPVPLPPRNFRL